jgi:hypothetical protein
VKAIAEAFEEPGKDIGLDDYGTGIKEFRWRTFAGGRAIEGFREYNPGDEEDQPPTPPKLREYTNPDIYYDTDTNKLVIGKSAVERHPFEGGYSSSLVPLADLLLDEEKFKEVPPAKLLDVSKWTRDDYAAYGKWLFSIVKNHHDPELKPVNEDVLRRARKLGLGPSTHRIASEFGSTTKFYLESDLAETHRLGVFENWTEEDYIEYLRAIGNKLGHKPTFKDLWRLSKESTQNPSPGYIAAKFNGKRGVGIGVAIERAGWHNPYTWKLRDYIDWGVNYMLANDGKIPSASQLNFLSKRDVGPSARATMNNFVSLVVYQEQVRAAYEQKLTEQANAKNELLQEIEDGLASNLLPSVVVSGVHSMNELFSKYARFRLARTLGMGIPGSYELSRLEVADFEDMALDIVENMSELKKQAAELGYQDYIWPPDAQLHRLTTRYWQLTPSKRKRLAVRSLGKLSELQPYPLLDATRKDQEDTRFVYNQQQIKEAVQNGEIPMSLFKGVNAPGEIIGRFMRFQTLRHMLPSEPIDATVRMCVPHRHPTELVALVAGKRPDLSRQEIAATIKSFVYLSDRKSS